MKKDYKLFLRWLKEIGVLNTWVSDFNSCGYAKVDFGEGRRHLSVEYFLRHCRTRSLIDWSFVWSRTGHERLWRFLDGEWTTLVGSAFITLEESVVSVKKRIKEYI